MKKYIEWLVINAAIAGLFVAGYHFDIEGARNVFLFMLWAALLPGSLVLVLAKSPVKDEAKKPPSVRAHQTVITRAMTLAILVSLAWQGHIVTALAWGAWMLLVAVFRHAVAQERQRLSGAKA
jgi:hypothetical protein